MLTLPLPPNIANGRMHWRTKNRKKLACWDQCDSWVFAYGQPKAPRVPPERARISVTMYLHQYMDDGNAMNRLKWLEDWLVQRGYLTDDSRKHLEYAGLPEQVIDRKRPRVEIVVEAVAERAA